jgi:uncharacterized SAM-binding protein YcdF (DUF218 family)
LWSIRAYRGEHKVVVRLASVLLLLADLFVALSVLAASGVFLTVDDPRPSDVILVLGGHDDETRYRKGLELLRAGYAGRLVVDADVSGSWFGATEASIIQEYVKLTAGSLAARVIVCPVRANSTRDETVEANSCLTMTQAKRVLLVTSDYHTRRALLIFRTRLPQYEWSVAGAVEDIEPGKRWWRNPSWVKQVAKEWTKLVYWRLRSRIEG